jgi:hypothetical protein
MAFNTLLTVFAIVAMADGVVAVLAPGPFVHFIWINRAGPETNLFVQGWGACVMAFGVMAWAGKELRDTVSRQMLALTFFTYNVIVSVLWVLDARERGWTPASAASFVGILLFTVAFGYFRFGRPRVGFRSLTAAA